MILRNHDHEGPSAASIPVHPANGSCELHPHHTGTQDRVDFLRKTADNHNPSLPTVLSERTEMCPHFVHFAPAAFGF